MDLKLTSKDMTTHGNTTWSLGEWRQIHPDPDPNAPLCSDSWIHFYHNTSPELAVVLNPIHASFTEPRLFRVETGPQQKHEALKSGATRLRLVEELPVPRVSAPSLVRFAIYAALEVGPHPKEWETWAQKWLDRSDRSRASAARAAEAAYECTNAGSRAAEAAYECTNAGSRAAEAGADAAWAAWTNKVWASARAARMAAAVAADAAWTASRAAEAAEGIDFNGLLKKAIDDEA